MIEIAYAIPVMSYGHCKMAVNSGFGRVVGVRGVDVDLGTKRIVVRGEDLDDASPWRRSCRPGTRRRDGDRG